MRLDTALDQQIARAGFKNCFARWRHAKPRKTAFALIGGKFIDRQSVLTCACADAAQHLASFCADLQ